LPASSASTRPKSAAASAQRRFLHFRDHPQLAGSTIQRGPEAPEIVPLQRGGPQQGGARHQGFDFLVFRGDDLGKLVGHGGAGKGRSACNGEPRKLENEIPAMVSQKNSCAGSPDA
jgi:hypothetical protein